MPLHPNERCCYKVHAYVRDMKDVFGVKFLLLLAFVQCFVNGVVFMGVNDSLFPFFKYLKVAPSQVQILGALSMTPWALKPILGALSDTIALGRYHKRYWMLLACVVGLIATIVLSTGVREVGVLVAMFFLVNFQIAFTDLLTEAKYAELMARDQKTGSNVVTLKIGLQQLGFIAAICFVGPLSDTQQFSTIYIICITFAASPLILILFGFMPETPLYGVNPVVHLDKEKLRLNKGMFLFVLMVGICGPLFSLWTALDLLQNEVLTRSLGVGASVLLLGLGVLGGYLVFPRGVAHVITYQVVTSLLSVRVGTALDFFYTADAACLPDGPHFSYAYYITFTGTLSVVVGLVSTFLYQVLFSAWRFRNVILLTTALGGLAGAFDLAMVLRWNVALGISDKAFYVIGEAILEKAIGTLLWIPTSTLIAKVCPPGLQAATYAYLAGMSNFAGSASSLAGAALIDLSGLQMQQAPCNWDALWILVLVGHVICRIVVGIPSAFLLPNIKQDEAIETATTTIDDISLQDIPMQDLLESDSEMDL